MDYYRPQNIASAIEKLKRVRLPKEPSLMVMLGHWSHTIDKCKAFNLLPRLLDEADPSYVRRGGKIDLPVYPLGTFINLSYMGYLRGISSKASDTYMKNVVEITVSGSSRNVGIKILPRKIHLTGKVDEIEAELIIRTVFSQLSKVNNLLVWIHRNREGCRTLVDEILRATCPEGSDLIQDPTQDEMRTLLATSGRLVWEAESCHGITPCYLLTYLLDLSGDFIRPLDYREKLKYALESNGFADPSITLGDIGSEMLNYNYNIGASLNKMEMVRVMEDSGEFLARYDSSIKEDVTIQYPHDEDEGARDKRRKDTLILRGKGSIMHSGRTRVQMEEVLSRFIDVLSRGLEEGRLSLASSV